MTHSVLSYRKVISKAVNRKWTTHEEREEWYTKFTMARRKKLEKLYLHQEGKCIFCQCETWLAERGMKKQVAGPGRRMKQMATLEHILPQYHGGTDRTTNLAMSCSGCNSLRGHLDFDYFMEIKNDPVKWKAHNKKMTVVHTQAAKARAIKSTERRDRLIFNIGLLLYIHSKFG